MIPNKEKGQITLFVIIGIVMLVIVFFTLSIIITNFESQLSQGEDLLSQYVDTDQLDFYFQSCIDETLDAFLQNMSKQGGILYDYQGGLGLADNAVEYDGFNVTRGLVFENPCSIVNSTPPAYPRSQTRLDRLPSIYNDNTHYTNNSYECWGALLYHSGYFGYHTMPRLCLQGGVNTGVNNQFSQVTPCLNNTRGLGRYTIEQNINKIIENHSFECIDSQPFQDIDGVSIEPILDEAITSVLFAPDRFLLNIEVPFELQSQDDNIRVDYVFDYSPGTNFVNLFMYVFELLRETAKKPYFDIPTNYATVEGYSGDYEINTHSLTDREYILEVVDTMEDLRFRTVIEARPPALDYINDDEATHTNLVFLENESLIFEPEGFDPDGHSYSYRYSGWMQDYNTSFDFMASPEVIPISALDTVHTYMSRFDSPSVNLMDSTLFTTTLKDAKVSLSKEHTGIHHTQVWIYNSTYDDDLFDYQNVSVAVVDLPMANFTFESYLDSGYFSSEIPLRINATSSKRSVLTGLSLDEFFLNITHSDTSLDPIHISSSNDVFVVINESTDILFYDEVFGKFLDKGNYTLQVQGKASLTGDRNLTSEPKKLEFPYSDDVKDCVNISNPDDHPYPYNNSDAFKADTPCCVNYAIASDDTVCYSETRFINWSDEDDRMSITKESKLQPYLEYHGYPSYPDESLGQGEFKIRRYCDGNRGNICAGNITATSTS